VNPSYKKAEKEGERRRKKEQKEQKEQKEGAGCFLAFNQN
jgi:hypothetical protein